MNNADMPAMPTSVDDPATSPAALSGGLTKREHFAAMAMQGLASAGHEDVREVAAHAVIMADALLAELEQDHG